MSLYTAEIVLGFVIEAMQEVGVTDDQIKQIDKLVSDKMEAFSDEVFGTKS